MYKLYQKKGQYRSTHSMSRLEETSPQKKTSPRILGMIVNFTSISTCEGRDFMRELHTRIFRLC